MGQAAVDGAAESVRDERLAAHPEDAEHHAARDRDALQPRDAEQEAGRGAEVRLAGVDEREHAHAAEATAAACASPPDYRRHSVTKAVAAVFAYSVSVAETTCVVASSQACEARFEKFPETSA